MVNQSTQKLNCFAKMFRIINKQKISNADEIWLMEGGSSLMGLSWEINEKAVDGIGPL
jgi:hypothetical protein